MKLGIDTIENVPRWAVFAIVYGDFDNITEEDEKLLRAWMKRITDEGWTLCMPIHGTDNEFCGHPAFGDACATVDFEAYREVE